MAICKKCGNEYLTRECLKCKGKEYSERLTRNNQHIHNEQNKEKKYYKTNQQLSEKDKLFKTIRYAIILFIIFIILGIIADIIITNYIFKSTEPTINYMNETSKDLIKEQKELMKKINQGFKTPNYNQ